MSLEIRPLDRAELDRVGEIDRTEHIDALYVQHGEQLTAHQGSWDSTPWESEGTGDHSVAARVRELHAYLARGGVAFGAWSQGRLVGVGVVVPRLREGIAQLAFLHVSAERRGTGVGSLLSARLDDVARGAGATTMVVSATPTRNTVAFYLGRGFVPMAHPLDELAELEPEDIHLHKPL